MDLDALQTRNELKSVPRYDDVLRLDSGAWITNSQTSPSPLPTLSAQSSILLPASSIPQSYCCDAIKMTNVPGSFIA